MDPVLASIEGTALSTVLENAFLQCAAREDACVLIISRPSAALAIARSIHNRSSRAGGPLTVVDCHDSGSSWAERLTQALTAGGATESGTLLLREIGEMSLAEQYRLADQLKHLRLHAKGPRIIVSNSTPLADRVEAGDFDDRLFYRLNTISLVGDDWRTVGAGRSRSQA